MLHSRSRLAALAPLCKALVSLGSASVRRATAGGAQETRCGMWVDHPHASVTALANAALSRVRDPTRRDDARVCATDSKRGSPRLDWAVRKRVGRGGYPAPRAYNKPVSDRDGAPAPPPRAGQVSRERASRARCPRAPRAAGHASRRSSAVTIPASRMQPHPASRPSSSTVTRRP